MTNENDEFRLDHSAVEQATTQRHQRMAVRIVLATAVLIVLAVIAVSVRNSTSDDFPASGTTSSDSGFESQEDDSGTDDSALDDSTLDDSTTDEDLTYEEESSSGPLAVDAPFENVDCTGEYVLLLRSSGEPAAYESTISDAVSWTSDVKYLRTNESCATFNQEVNGNDIYAAYTGPFGTLAEACQARLDVGRVEAVPRMLDMGSEHRSFCVCDSELTPTYSIDNDYDPAIEDQMNISEAQSMLYWAGFNPTQATGGHFREETQKMVTAFQVDRGLTETSELDDETWAALTSEEC